ncbi:MAG: DUF1553 domain-containing protein [Planctomycetaceae bacterium]|nr:DUF1553 domain-containing protein [Planctomycetaceae bacterium]
MPQTAVAAGGEKSFTTGSSDVLIDYINEKIRQSWTDNEVAPSDVADDEEWIRRVYLDIVGHIPPLEVVEKFLDDRDPAKRSKLIEQLLDDPAYVRNWTTIWTNLSIGRLTPRRVSRTGMQKFYREAFARNRPWDEVVFDLVSAEGHFEENGAVNYLLAQMTMRDEAVQATAKTTRLFMGLQVQCTQCHNHPFNDWKQDQFWQFNSFFRQARREDHEKYDPKTGRMVDDYSEIVREDFSGPVYFEKRSGLMQVAYPQYFDARVDPGEEIDRRRELAKLMTEGEQPLIARAMVNRMWGHFFGYGFTKPIDDMGPHNPPTHPELLDRLTVEFVKSGYDVRQLVRWITNSEAYNLTSQVGRKNEIDNPAAGEPPLFSHMYVKSMEAEQLFDSLIVATGAHQSGRSSWEDAEQQRQNWLRQFVVAFGTDEGDESTTFNGTIPQALMMMNGELIQNAIAVEKGGWLREVLTDSGSDAQKVRTLFLATLSRQPTRREFAAANKLIRGNRDKLAAWQDLYWALLNSNEFIFNH